MDQCESGEKDGVEKEVGELEGLEIIPLVSGHCVTTVISGSEMLYGDVQNPHNVSIHRALGTHPFQPSDVVTTILGQY